MDTLHTLLLGIKESFGVQICVHDVSGVTYARAPLHLPYLWLQHGCDYCSVAKRCVGEKRCMRQKQLVMWLLRRRGPAPFYGVCHMGVCEYILPVMQDARLIAVIFASGLTVEDAQESRRKVHIAAGRIAPEHGRELLAGYEAFCAQSGTTRAALRFFAELTRERILRAGAGLVEADAPDPYAVEALRSGREHSGTVRAILGYIEAGLPGAISLSDLSAAFFLSEGHLCRLFKKEMGVSIIAYVKRERIHRAARLLREGEDSVAAVAAQVGLSDPNYFCRAFRQEMGLSPTEYRRSALHASTQGQNKS